MIAGEPAGGVRWINEIGRVGASDGAWGISGRSAFDKVSREWLISAANRGSGGSVEAVLVRGGVANSMATRMQRPMRMSVALIMISRFPDEYPRPELGREHHSQIQE
jgi:hypothetical protein